VVVLLPWILSSRLHHLPRYFEYVNTRSTANWVISANAHNLWWLPTLARSQWIDDWEPFVGPLSYRMVATALVLAWLGFCLFVALRLQRRTDLYLVAGALGYGFFTLMVRAHENHSFLALAFLVLAAGWDGRRWPLYALGSAALLLNLGLHDPALVGSWASPPAPEQPQPLWLTALQLLNVGLNFLMLGLLARALLALPRRAAPP
jgi:hypothetical protein